jgi:hypothetical protein
MELAINEQLFAGGKMKLSRIYFLFLLLFLFVPAISYAQRSNSVTSAANKSWSNFFMEFRAAVTKRDRTALKRMVSSEFDWTAGELGISPNDVLNHLDREKMWNVLQKALVISRFRATTYGNRPARSRINGTACFFVYEADGKWRWQGFLGD